MKTFKSVIIVMVLVNQSFAQLVSQSTLSVKDMDSDFKMTMEHLALGSRWMGVPPRDITWSPEGEKIYFRWNIQVDAKALPDKDPWFVVDRSATKVAEVPDNEIFNIPSDNIQYSGDRKIAVWSRGSTLYLWKKGKVQPVYSTKSELANVQISWTGDKVYFSTDISEGDIGNLWVYEVSSGHIRQLVRAVEEKDPEEVTEAGNWIMDEELELIKIVNKRKNDEETKKFISRNQDPFNVLELPIQKGTRAYSFKMSPDGRFISFQWIKDPSDDHRTQFMEFVNKDGYATMKEARPKVGEPLPSHKMGVIPYSPDIDEEDLEIIWVDDGQEKETVMHGPYWNPKGTAAVVQILSMDHKDRWISLLDIESGKTEVINHQHENAWIGGPLVEGRWRAGYLQWLPDGKSFGFFSTATGWSMLYTATVKGKVTQMTNGEWEVRDAYLSPDGKTWYLTTSKEHPGEEQFYHLPVKGGKLKRITREEGKHAVTPSPDGSMLALRSESTKLLPDLYLQENKKGASSNRVTKSGSDEFFRYDWLDSEIISYPDAAGEETWAEIWEKPDKPNGAAVIYAHGCGECAQAVDKGWSRIGARLYANYVVQKGYVAASVDYRGSSGYGHKNRTYAYRQMGISDVDSALPLLDILAENYSVNKNRIGIYGGSYGGFFTLMSLFRHPGKYAAGVSIYPVTDWAHYNQGYTSRILNGSPTNDPEAYRRSSPVYYAEGLRDALQIQHGLVDGNVQIQDSFRLTQILMEKKKKFDLVVYPMEDHGWDEIPSRRDSYERMMDWFNRYLLKE
ncbi:MAG: hypothetical protein CMG71_06290 [Candidatus Marinimicrobia bacterium]|nr:hypothetical protein [Candidatus Neomarinimicrobiota bacterium]|tara:strand:+ start:8728 stop:11097 length:2370 start_codon:yes stop_codon:yes gene_type:complete